MTVFFASADSSQPTPSLTASLPAANSAVCEQALDTSVGQNANSSSVDRYAAKPFTISDEQREAAIALAAAAVERYMAEYERTHCFGAYGNADRARMSMESLIKLRSPAQIAKMERERGLV